jgi:hypothetical protein
MQWSDRISAMLNGNHVETASMFGADEAAIADWNGITL